MWRIQIHTLMIYNDYKANSRRYHFFSSPSWQKEILSSGEKRYSRKRNKFCLDGNQFGREGRDLSEMGRELEFGRERKRLGREGKIWLRGERCGKDLAKRKAIRLRAERFYLDS
jgi:hypothetical protein